MGTRRRDAQRRQVSLAVEALEDRFLLSDAVSVSIPAATNGPLLPPAPAHIPAAGKEARSVSSQGNPDHSPAWQTTALPLHPMMSYQRDDDGDNDFTDITDRDNMQTPFSEYPLICSTGNHTTGCLDFTLPVGSPEQITLPTASLVSFLPLLSASGLGVTNIASLLPAPWATAIEENAPRILDPVPGKEELRPMPAAPEMPPSALPPLVQERPEPPPSSTGGPLAELLPIDGEAIQRGVDAFFQQLRDLSEEWRDGEVLEKLAPWLLAASVAGYGWIRLHDRRGRYLADPLGFDQPGTILSIFLSGRER